MICKNAIVVFDPSSSLPSYGENRISSLFEDGSLLVSIFFDGVNEERKISMKFEHVVFHKISSFPGVNDTIIQYEHYTSIGALVEFQDSQFKNKWEEHFNHLFKLKHLRIAFLSANNLIEVICERVFIDSSDSDK